MNPNLLDELNQRLREQYSSLRDINVSNDILNKLTQQIAENEQQINDYIENSVEITNDLIERNNKLINLGDERIQSQEKLNQLTEELKKELAGVLGGSEDIAEIFKTGGIFALGAKAAISGFEKMGEQFSNIVGTAFHMTHELGISARDAAIIGGEIGKANFSMTGLLYGSEATAEAAHALADQYGNAGMATSDMIKGVTQLSALTGDAASAVDLALAYENAGIAASDVVHNIEEIAGSVGVNANKVAKEMAENQDLIVNATKEELALNTRLTAELVKQGVTRESIKSSSKSLMDIENNIQQANKFRLMTGKQLDVQALTGAAVQLQTARGTENKLEAEKNLLNVIKEQMGAQENYSEMSYKEQEIVQNMLGMDHERLLAMEKANQAFDLNTELLEQGNAFMGAITAGATSAGAGFGAMTLELVKMVAQAMIFNKVMTGNSGFSNMFKGRGGGGVSDIVPGVGDTSVDGGKVGSIGKSIGSTGRGVGSAMKGIAVGFKSFAAPQVALGVGVVTAGIIGLGFALKLAAPGIIAIGKAIGEVIGSIGDFIVKIATPETANGLLSLAPAFAALGLAFIPLAVGLAAMTPVIPTLVALVALGAGIALIANALNGGGGGSSTETSGGSDKKSDPLLEEIRGLRADIKNQPINVVLNNKIVGEINRGSRAINSYVNKP